MKPGKVLSLFYVFAGYFVGGGKRGLVVRALDL